QPEPAEKHVTQRLQPERGSPKKCEAEEAEPPAATQPQTSETQTSHLPESERIHHTVFFSGHSHASPGHMKLGGIEFPVPPLQ
ncbi:ACIN1 isoform 8, partial [Pongo abelii]